MRWHEPPHQDLCCLQIQLFSSLVLKEFKLLSERLPVIICQGLNILLSTPMGVDYVEIGFDMEPLVTHNVA